MVNNGPSQEKIARREKMIKACAQYRNVNSLLHMDGLAEKYSKIGGPPISRSHISKCLPLYDAGLLPSLKPVPGAPIIPSVHRKKALVSDRIIEKLKESYSLAAMAGNGISSRDIINQIEHERLLELGPDVNIDSLKPMARSTGFYYVALIAPAFVKRVRRRRV